MQVYQEQPTEQTGSASVREPIECSMTIRLNDGYGFDRHVISESAAIFPKRRMKLVKYRNICAVVSIMLVILALASPDLGIPYEPIVAILISVFGTFFIFMLKVMDVE